MTRYLLAVCAGSRVWASAMWLPGRRPELQGEILLRPLEKTPAS